MIQNKREQHGSSSLFIGLSVLAFLFYAAGVLALNQDRNTAWGLETAAAVPAAISHLSYGTPFGAMDSNVRGNFWRLKTEMSLDEAIQKVANGSITKGSIEPWGADGIGAGTTLFGTISMWLFGMYMSSFVYFFLGLLSISTTAFIIRFQDTRLFSVPLYFVALSAMLLTPLASIEVASGVPIGGNRYFSVAATLPVLHLWLEIVDETDARLTTIRALLLFVQAMLLFAVLLVRSSAALLLLVIVGTLFWKIANRQSLSRVIACTVCIAAAGFLWAWIVNATMPAYVESGRVLGNFWHRAFASFYLHPNWPFGSFSQRYDCTWAFPQGFSTGADASATCVWFSQPAVRALAHAPLALSLYGAEYERVLRGAFFEVIRGYPKEVLELFVLVKSKLIWVTLATALRDLWNIPAATVPQPLVWLVGVQMAVFFTFVIVGVARGKLLERWTLIFPFIFIVSLVPFYVGWAYRTTSADAVSLLYMNVGLMFALCLQIPRSIFMSDSMIFGKSRTEPIVTKTTDKSAP